ncbi:5-oxoprolinase/urea amidolyase family protein [Rhodococcus sp. ARC_M12]|uniref:5-oxoprolinase/urea amidolyase family protein n=1 Tax=Rhodococcus sp. ARC_M12 TaxID=2928854 RepID=UPI001FB50BF0|nr:5-oxoprolinase/urea amidolyase family protein [Rhodococcus sp. ARC_M12]MCJ0980021.1 5-oxoprolinase/urea amidolyase family protein [Rhodococcus sp. ARC_M12]
MNAVNSTAAKMTVQRPGMITTVQDWPGRIGYWKVGVPPSGPMDDLSFRLGNVALGNPEGAPGLESTMAGPALTFDADTYVCVTGAAVLLRIDGRPVPQWKPVLVPAGSTLDVGPTTGHGLRVYVLIQGSLDVDDYLGSAATFTLGKFGGHRGGTLGEGDVIGLAGRSDNSAVLGPIPMEHLPVLTSSWDIAVTEGPHGAPEFFTRDDIDTLYATRYEVHFNSDRTGVRLIGPKPQWARTDGGEAGLHPSNIHDNAYSVGALDFTGDTPILLGPDGPSLGGFVCPVTVVAAERWKLGQLRPGDTIRFVPVRAAATAPLGSLGLARRASLPAVFSAGGDGDDGVIARRDADTCVTYRRSGDDNVLIEYGDMKLDLTLRARVHALHQRIEGIAPRGLLDLTPGIRSLQVKVNPDVLSIDSLMGLLSEVEDDLPAASELVVPSRQVRLPLSWDDPSTREAIQRYMHGVRADAPWCPWNIEFIRRMNGLDSVADVFDTVFAADYMVLGLGDVYLGAPVATPLDPRHRLVTTKYNPARTWTPENAVGIGGAYLCIYGMEGPGGYQFVGRTTQVWNHSAAYSGGPFEEGTPWLLRFFDRISWYSVEPEELLDLRADLAAGRGGGVEITDGEFSLAEHETFLDTNADSIAEFRATQAVAFGAERDAWSAAGEFDKKGKIDAA